MVLAQEYLAELGEEYISIEAALMPTVLAVAGLRPASYLLAALLLVVDDCTVARLAGMLCRNQIRSRTLKKTQRRNQLYLTLRLPTFTTRVFRNLQVNRGISLPTEQAATGHVAPTDRDDISWQSKR